MLDMIYSNICFRSLDNATAEQVIATIEQCILLLETMPYRGANVTSGIYASHGYRKLMVKNHLIIYSVLEEKKQVVIVFVKNVKVEI